MNTSERGVPPFTLVLPEDLGEERRSRRPHELTWVPRRRRREPPAPERSKDD